MISEPVGVIIMTVWYQFIDRSWVTLFWLIFVSMLLTTIILCLVLKESPKWLYINTKFDEARQELAAIAKFNSVDSNYITNQVLLKKFDVED